MSFKEWFAKKQGEFENTSMLSDFNLYYPTYEECWEAAQKELKSKEVIK